MAKKKVTTVKEHPRRVPISKKNPVGVTIVDKHPRRLDGTFLDIKEIEKITKSYDLKKLVYPTSGKLIQYSDSDKYDQLIAMWTDFFNKKFPSESLFDPDVIKALIGSESDFKSDPVNPQAVGIAQITKETFKALKDPKVAIPMAVRWLFRKKRLAEGKLGKDPSAEEIILEYKGLLKSTSKYKEKALEKFKELYGLLKN